MDDNRQQIMEMEMEIETESNTVTTELKDLCVWKRCTRGILRGRRYSVDEKNPRIATKTEFENRFCTLIGSTFIPRNKVTSWGIKILKSWGNNGGYIFIGVAPSDIDQNESNRDKCGWYFDCYRSALISGPPHNYRDKEYGQRKDRGEYVHTGDSVGAVMDTTKGELSFVVNGMNHGVAYEGIPLDKPLVPCVILHFPGDSVELVFLTL